MDNKNNRKMTLAEKLQTTGQLINLIGNLFIYIALLIFIGFIFYTVIHH